MCLFRLCFPRCKLRICFLALILISGASVCSAQSLQFHASSPVNTSLPPLYVLTADLNNDGFEDLLIVTSESTEVPSSLNVFLGNGDAGTFKPGTTYPLGIAGSSTPGRPLLGQIRLTGPNLWDVIVPMTAANSVDVLGWETAMGHSKPRQATQQTLPPQQSHWGNSVSTRWQT